MKTFETEKNNIPEGATHHGVYGCDTDVYFKKDGDTFLRWKHNNWSLSEFAHHNWVKPIPKPETTEWKDKDNVPPVGWRGLSSYTSEGCDDWCDFHDGVVMGVNGDHVWMAHHGKFQRVHHISEIEFKEPESPEEKEKRERLEAAYDLYLAFKESAGCEPITFAKWSATQPTDSWLAIVDKTNYRKGE